MRVVPYGTPLRRRTRPTLDQTTVVRAALALLDTEGLEALTMRRLATRLGVQATALYRHVRAKEELLVLVSDEIAAGVPLPPRHGSWRARLATTAWNTRRGLLAHRDGAQLLALTPPAGPRRLRLIEAVLQVLREAGLSARQAARTAYHMNNFVTEFAADEARLRAIVARSGRTRRALFGQVKRQFLALPQGEFPNLVGLSKELTEDAPDEMFEFGLTVWLDAISELARRRGSGTRKARGHNE